MREQANQKLMISDEAIEEFRQIFREEYGVEYTMQEAHQAARNLIGYFELLLEMDRDNKKQKQGNKR